MRKKIKVKKINKTPIEYVPFSEYQKIRTLLSFSETYLKTRAAHDPIIRDLMSDVYGSERQQASE